MSDALVSIPVAAVAAAAAVGLLAVAVRKVSRAEHVSTALMGVMGAFVFAAQMVNFSIPGTGSSGHIVGGILLAALLGPWAAFLTLATVLVLQCLMFADGGLLALGCNILNMAACTCLVAYPLIYKPLARADASSGRLMWVSVVACTVGLLLGAVCVTVETVLSGITVLPFGEFFAFMMPIHFVIGICEGLATGAVLAVIRRSKPELLVARRENRARPKLLTSIVVLGICALLIAGVLSFAASSLPDGLEWAVMHTTEGSVLPSPHNPLAESVVLRTAVMPDYNSSAAGIAGSGIIIVAALVLTAILGRRSKSRKV